jgi:hypothetical protein
MAKAKKPSGKAGNVRKPDPVNALSEEDLERVSGGADALRLLAQVSHHQAESAASDLETIADKQEMTRWKLLKK